MGPGQNYERRQDPLWKELFIVKAHKDNVLCENIVSRFYYGFILTVYCKKSEPTNMA